jgi:hypothetical protein
MPAQTTVEYRQVEKSVQFQNQDNTNFEHWQVKKCVQFHVRTRITIFYYS